jgi:hypothetical protein
MSESNFLFCNNSKVSADFSNGAAWLRIEKSFFPPKLETRNFSRSDC